MKMAPTWIIKNLHRTVLAGLSLLLFSGLSAASNLIPQSFEIHAQSRIYGMNVKLVQTLSQNEEGVFTLSQNTKAPFISIDENSTFSFDENQILVPASYTYQRSVFGAKLKRNNSFAEDLLSASYKKNKDKTQTIELDGSALSDQLNFIIPIQQWAKTAPKVGETTEVKLLKRKSVKAETYQLVRYEWIKTELGWFETAVIEKLHDSDRRTIIWLAKDWQYMLVKMLHSDDDVGEQTIATHAIYLQGKEIKGLKSKPE